MQRSWIVTSVLLVLGALGTLTLTRLGAALAQLRAVDLSATAAPLAAPELAPTHVVGGPALAVAPERGRQPPTRTEGAALGPTGDEHIKQWLANDPDFMRAADELLREPDPQLQHDARQLLRDLGAFAP